MIVYSMIQWQAITCSLIKARDALNSWTLHIDHSLDSLINRITSISLIRSMLTYLVESRITIVEWWIDIDQSLSLKTDQETITTYLRESKLSARRLDWRHDWLILLDNRTDTTFSKATRSDLLSWYQTIHLAVLLSLQLERKEFNCRLSRRSIELFQICFIVKATRSKVIKFLQNCFAVRATH